LDPEGISPKPEKSGILKKICPQPPFGVTLPGGKGCYNLPRYANLNEKKGLSFKPSMLLEIIIPSIFLQHILILLGGGFVAPNETYVQVVKLDQFLPN